MVKVLKFNSQLQYYQIKCHVNSIPFLTVVRLYKTQAVVCEKNVNSIYPRDGEMDIFRDNFFLMNSKPELDMIICAV